MRMFVGFGMICCVGVLAGCSSSITNPPPVSAQTGYSNASLNGTYSVNLGGMNGSNEAISDFIGTFRADGSGNLVAGTLMQYGTDGGGLGSSCSVTFTGTYNVKTDASGTATLTVASAGADYCSLSGQMKFALEAGQQGAALHLGESDGVGLLAGTATKQ